MRQIHPCLKLKFQNATPVHPRVTDGIWLCPWMGHLTNLEIMRAIFSLELYEASFDLWIRRQNTNVVELYDRIIKDDQQLTYYNSGIGTYARPSWRSLTYLTRTLYHKIDLAIAL